MEDIPRLKYRISKLTKNTKRVEIKDASQYFFKFIIIFFLYRLKILTFCLYFSFLNLFIISKDVTRAGIRVKNPRPAKILKTNKADITR